MKKRISSVILAIVLIVTANVSISAVSSVFGDANNDGDVTAADARLVLRVSASLEEPTERILNFADTNEDGEITASDARTILRVSADLESFDCLNRGKEHKYIFIKTINPTCITEGYDLYKCSFCNSEVKSNIVQAGHYFSDWINNNDKKIRNCLNCGFVETADNDESQIQMPVTDAEWLDFFNTSVNKLKTEVPEMIKTKQTRTVDISLSNPLGAAYVSIVKDQYLSDDIVERHIAKGDKDSAQANISPDGAEFVSALTMEDVLSISHTTDISGNYVIKIAMNDAVNPELDGPYGKVFEFMTIDDVMNKYVPDMGATVDRSNVELQFKNCSASATITPDGKVVCYETTVNANMILKEAKIKVITTDVNATLCSVTKYFNINW